MSGHWERGPSRRQRRAVGENADQVTEATDFAVEPLQGVGGPDLASVLDGETVVGAEVDLGLLEGPGADRRHVAAVSGRLIRTAMGTVPNAVGRHRSPTDQLPKQVQPEPVIRREGREHN